MIDSSVFTYRMMQSDENSFWGDVVLESFKKAYEDNIFDQTHKKAKF